MEPVFFKEVFEYPVKEFKEHLENPLNERIIFSGKYGIGKTTFIKNYFEIDSNLEKYDTFRLFPVNYTVSSNEDILKYIKHDILIELLRKKRTLEEFDLRFIDTLPLYIKNNLFKVIAGTIAMVPKVGKDISDALEKIEKLRKKFIEFHNKLNETEGDIVVDYLEKLELQDGTIYESDIVTKIISNTIKKSKPKESILIVDDIDRLDPEHVFRILNVFAAHFDRPGSAEKNKFNFDKVIVVCDFQNIRNLFHHRYGVNVDFMGYIDKFFSSDIYFFDNKKAIVKILGNIFDSTSYMLRSNESPDSIKQLYFQNGFIFNITSIFLERNLINLRSILRLYEKYITYHYDEINIGDRINTSSYRLLIATQLKLLRYIFGDYNSMLKAFENAADREFTINRFELYFGLLVHFLSYDIRLSDRKDVDFTYRGVRLIIEARRDFMIDSVNAANIYEYKESANGNADRGLTFVPSIDLFWSALIDVTKKLNRIGFLD
jgi:hypothetical protein